MYGCFVILKQVAHIFSSMSDFTSFNENGPSVRVDFLYGS